MIWWLTKTWCNTTKSNPSLTTPYPSACTGEGLISSRIASASWNDAELSKLKYLEKNLDLALEKASTSRMYMYLKFSINQKEQHRLTKQNEYKSYMTEWS